MTEEDAAPPSESLLSKVRKLLAKAENPACTPAEAAALNDKAAELIAKYGVDRALLANAGEAIDVVGDRVIVCEAPYAHEKAVLLGAVAKPLRVRHVFLPAKSKLRNDRGFEVHLFGFSADLERVDILFTSLLVQASFGLATVTPELYYWRSASASSTASHRRDWLTAFAVRIRERLTEIEQRVVGETVQATTGTDIVLRDRNQAVASAVAVVYPKLIDKPGRSIRNGSAWHAGRTAADRADLGGTRVTRGTQRSVTR